MYQSLILGGALFLAVQHIGFAAGMASLDVKVPQEVKDERNKVAGISYGVAVGVMLLYLFYAMHTSRGKTFSWGRRAAAMAFIFFLVAFGIYMAIPKEHEMDHTHDSQELKDKKKMIVQQVHAAAIGTGGLAAIVAYMMKF
jgi:hypothetical protein